MTWNLAQAAALSGAGATSLAILLRGRSLRWLAVPWVALIVVAGAAVHLHDPGPYIRLSGGETFTEAEYRAHVEAQGEPLCSEHWPFVRGVLARYETLDLQPPVYDQRIAAVIAEVCAPGRT